MNVMFTYWKYISKIVLHFNFLVYTNYNSKELEK